MNIRLRGSFTPSRKLEHQCLVNVEHYAPLILGDYLNDIKTINVWFCDYKVDWKQGYKWLLNNKEIKLVIAKGYRSHFRAEWMIIHDLCHCAQMIEKRLNKSVKKTWYRSPTSEYHYRYDMLVRDGKWVYRRLDDGVTFRSAPWEDEANDMTDRYMGTIRSNKAWR